MELNISDFKLLLETCMADAACQIQKNECIGKDYNKELERLKKLYTYNCLFDCFQTQEEIDDAVCDIQSCGCSNITPTLKVAKRIDAELEGV